MGIRFAALIGGVAVAYGALLFHLYDLQIMQGDHFLARASSQLAAGDTLEAPRGVIYFTDKHGNRSPAALNKQFPVVFAVPSEMQDAARAVAALAPFTDMPRAELDRRLANKQSSFVLLKKKADQAYVDSITALHLPGVHIDTVPFRYYPLGTAAASVIGFVGPGTEDARDRGRYGVESFYDTHLAGTPGILRNGKVTFPQPGDDLTLTIDPTIQLEAEKQLTSLVQRFSAKGGSIIVMDPKTGRLLALANAPGFDPNAYQKGSVEAFTNPAAQAQYEPGSVFKVLTMAAGIDSGKITPNTTVYDNGALELNGHTIHNWDLNAYGTVTATNIIEHSLNVGTALIQRIIGNSILKTYFTKFGFNHATEVDLPGEVDGNLDALFADDAPPVAFATASFGQGVAATPLQVLTAIGALANEGKRMRPYVNTALDPHVAAEVLRPETARQVTEMMVRAVDTNKVARVPGYAIAGKTGTAQLPDLKRGGYTDKVINTYVGFGPATNPRFVILVKLNQPAGAPLAGQTVVPVFRDLAQFVLNYYEIPPDRVDTTQP